MGFATITMTVLHLIPISFYWKLQEGIAVASRSQPLSHCNRLNNNRATKPMQIAAGGGDYSAPFTVYVPDNAEVKVGQAVNWYNPTDVGEPHTVTFVMDNSTMGGVVSLLFVPNTTTFASSPPNSNNEPIVLPVLNGTNTLIALNARHLIQLRLTLLEMLS